MTEYMGVSIRDYRWKPYPSKNFEEQKAFELSSDEIYKASAEKRYRINELKANYTGKLINHRAENKSNYDFLNEIQGNLGEEGKRVVSNILGEHRTKEQKINMMNKNLTFRSMDYTRG